VTLAALLDPPLLHPPIASPPLLCPGGQDLLGIELRLALMLQSPLSHGQYFFDWLSKEDLPVVLGSISRKPATPGLLLFLKLIMLRFLEITSLLYYYYQYG
jgi:hypothetical protein